MKETIKVVCYKSKTLSNGEHPIMVCVNKDGKRKYQSLGISIKEELWDFKKNLPKPKCPNRDKITLIIHNHISELEKAALDKKMAGADFTASTLLEASASNNGTVTTVGECFLKYIQNLVDEKRVRYAGMLQISYSSFIKFNKHLDIPFADITTGWLKKYECWMKKNELSTSTTSTRLRHLRAVFNYAISEHLIKNDCYPFKAYKISKLNTQTVKRAITKDEIKKIIRHQGKTPMEILAIDLFTFSYFMAGINFIDMAYLQKYDIVDNHIRYYRKKTKKLINIPIQSKLMEIITKYQNENSPYIFPILSSYHKTEVQKANRLHKVLAKVNKHLKELGKELKLPMPLTTYVARHSFATVLKRAGVATSIISESLGHSSEHITQVYLDSFDNEQIDKAMKNLQ